MIEAECVVRGSGALGASVALLLAAGGKEVALVDKHALELVPPAPGWATACRPH
jgi:glycine/D-amino acid oxidase-like deaminating enzyme